MANQRVTLCRDPLNEQDWVVASDFGDPSEEVVLSTHRSYDAAMSAAEAAAGDRSCTVVEEDCTLR